MNMSVPDIYLLLNCRSHERLTIFWISLFSIDKYGVGDADAFHGWKNVRNFIRLIGILQRISSLHVAFVPLQPSDCPPL